MELNELKYAWDGIETPIKSTDEIRQMLSENKHPVLKKVRLQITIETIGWLVFLICYYTIFDGDRKPFWLNMAMVVSVLLPLTHNLMGYSFARFLVNGTTIKESLKNYISNVKIYATVSIGCRLFFTIGLVLFFTYGLNFTTKKCISVAIIASLFLIQLFLLYKLWANRLKNLNRAITQID